MSFDKYQYEEDIQENFYAESPRCDRCSSQRFELLKVDYDRSDGWAEAVFLCKVCEKGKEVKFIHPGLS